MRKDPVWNIVKDSRLKNLNAGKHQWRFAIRKIFGDGHAAKPLQEAVRSLDHREFFARDVWQKYQGRDCLRSPVSCKRRVQVYVGNNLSVDYNKGVTVQQRTRVVDRSAGAKDFRFFNIMQLHSKPAAVAERLSH